MRSIKSVSPLAALITLVLVCFAVGANTLSIGRIRQQAQEMPTVVVQDVQERILQLPEDGDVWHTSLFVRPDYQRFPADRTLVAAFASDPQLASLKAQTHYHLYTTDSAIFRERFSGAITELPSVMVQNSDGEVIYKQSGPKAAASPQRLAADIQQNCRGRHCRPQPTPPATPVPPPVEPKPDPIPDVAPPPKNESALVLLALFAAVFIAVIGMKLKGEVAAGS